MSQLITKPPAEGDDGDTLFEGDADEVFLSTASMCTRYDGKSRMTIWRWVQAGILPKPVKIGPQCNGFRLSEVLTTERSWPRASTKVASKTALPE